MPVLMSEPQPASTWHCFPEEGPPEGAITGVRMLLGLPRGAQTNLWHLIRVGLEEPETPEHRQQIENYAMRFEANPAQLIGAVRACQYILRQAAARKVELNDFLLDLQRLSGTDRGALELLAPHYVRVRNQLRLQLLENTLADHGNVLVGFDWRIDTVNVSNHGEMDSVPVVFLNLVYRNGEETKKLPVQLSPSAIASLKDFLSRFETA
jgi:hypothetical protein